MVTVTLQIQLVAASTFLHLENLGKLHHFVMSKFMYSCAWYFVSLVFLSFRRCLDILKLWRMSDVFNGLF